MIDQTKLRPNPYLTRPLDTHPPKVSCISSIWDCVVRAFRALFCCCNSSQPRITGPVQPLDSSEIQATDLPVGGNLEAALRRKILASSHSYKGMTNRQKFAAEGNRLQEFLKTEPSSSVPSAGDDLVYFCIGHGNVAREIWIRPVLERLKEGKKVRMVLLEMGQAYEFSNAPRDLNTACTVSSCDQANVYTHLEHLSIDQFLCGLPFKEEEYLEEMASDDVRIQNYETEEGEVYWKSQAQVQEIHDNFRLYIEQLLKQGKIVIIGAHCDGLEIESFLVQTYNRFVTRHSGQLFFFHGWDCSRATSKPITAEDTAPEPEKTSKIWRVYPRSEGGFLRARLEEVPQLSKSAVLLGYPQLSVPLSVYIFEKTNEGIRQVNENTDPCLSALRVSGNDCTFSCFGNNYKLDISEIGKYTIKCDPLMKNVQAIFPKGEKRILKPSS